MVVSVPDAGPGTYEVQYTLGDLHRQHGLHGARARSGAGARADRIGRRAALRAGRCRPRRRDGDDRAALASLMSRTTPLQGTPGGTRPPHDVTAPLLTGMTTGAAALGRRGGAGVDSRRAALHGRGRRVGARRPRCRRAVGLPRRPAGPRPGRGGRARRHGARGDGRATRDTWLVRRRAGRWGRRDGLGHRSRRRSRARCRRLRRSLPECANVRRSSVAVCVRAAARAEPPHRGADDRDGGGDGGRRPDARWSRRRTRRRRSWRSFPSPSRATPPAPTCTRSRARRGGCTWSVCPCGSGGWPRSHSSTACCRHSWPTVTARYSVLAGWSFALVAFSGVANALVRVGSLDGMRTDYGVLVLVKSVALVALGVAGWLHRRRLLDAIGQAAGRVAFWRLVAAELVLMGVASGVAVALSRTATPVPDEPPPAATPARAADRSTPAAAADLRPAVHPGHPRRAVDRRGRRAAAHLRARSGAPAQTRRPLARAPHGPVGARLPGAALRDVRRDRRVRAHALQRPHGAAHDVEHGGAAAARLRRARHAGAACPAEAHRRVEGSAGVAARPGDVPSAQRAVAPRGRSRRVRRQHGRLLLHASVRPGAAHAPRARADDDPLPARRVPVRVRPRRDRPGPQEDRAPPAAPAAVRHDGLPRLLRRSRSSRRRRCSRRPGSRRSGGASTPSPTSGPAARSPGASARSRRW